MAHRPPRMMRMSAVIVPSLLSMRGRRPLSKGHRPVVVDERACEDGKHARPRPRQAGPGECAPSLPNFAPNRKPDVAGANRERGQGRANVRFSRIAKPEWRQKWLNDP